MAYKHGKNGYVKFAASTWKVTTWEGEHTAPEVEATNTESGGAQEMSDVDGVESMNGTITMILVAGSPPPGPSAFGALELGLGGKTTADAFQFQAKVNGFKYANPVKSTDPLTVSASFKSSGAITAPTN